MRLAGVVSARCSSPKSIRGTPGCFATKSICAMNIASSAAAGEPAAEAALSTRASRRSATHSITACHTESLVGKCRKSAPWVRFIRSAIAVVVISLGFCSAASSITVATVTERRSSAGRCFGRVSGDWLLKVSKRLLTFDSSSSAFYLSRISTSFSAVKCRTRDAPCRSTREPSPPPSPLRAGRHQRRRPRLQRRDHSQREGPDQTSLMLASQSLRPSQPKTHHIPGNGASRVGLAGARGCRQPWYV